METFPVLLVLCSGNLPVTGEFSPQRPVTRSFHVFFDLRVWTHSRANNRDTGDLRRHRTRYDITVMYVLLMLQSRQRHTSCMARKLLAVRLLVQVIAQAITIRIQKDIQRTTLFHELALQYVSGLLWWESAKQTERQDRLFFFTCGYCRFLCLFVCAHVCAPTPR